MADYRECGKCGEEYNALQVRHECAEKALEQIAQDEADDQAVRDASDGAEEE